MNIFREGRVGVVALSTPSSGKRREKIERAITYLESVGAHLVIGETVFSELGYKSASRELRARDLMTLFANPEISLILNTTGGFNSVEILDLLDYDLIRRNRKWFVGYSDITAVNLALYSQAELCSVNGAMLIDYVDDPDCFKTLDSLLTSSSVRLEPTTTRWESGLSSSYPAPSVQFLDERSNEATGFAIVGNLSTFNLLIGTPYFPALDGAILFLEYDKEEANALQAVERLLWQLRLAGYFQNINGFVFGALENSVQEEEKQKGRTVRDILSDVFKPYSYPVLYEVQFGHTYPSRSIVNGQTVSVNGNEIFLSRPELSPS